MNIQETTIKTTEFISRFVRNHDLQPHDDIFAMGFVNSLFAMQLVLFVEQEFGITVEDEDLELDNFRTVERITALVERKNTSLTHA
jgi:acyl carrier protein